MDELESLVALTEADQWIERVRAQKLQLPEVGELELLETEMKELASHLTARAEWLAPLKQDLAEVSAKVTVLTSRKVELERRQAAPSATPKELVALQGELEHLVTELQALENNEIELFMRVEPLEQELVVLSAMAKEKVARRQGLRNSVAELTGTLDEEIAALVHSRTAVLAAIPEALRVRYEGARAHVGGGVGAAHVTNGRCTGCHISLSPLDLDRLKRVSGTELLSCPECSRLLLP